MEKKRNLKKKIRVKNKWLLISILLVVILIVSLISAAVFIFSKKLVLEYDKIVELSINEKYNSLDSIKKIENGKIITKNKKIDTSKIGEQKINFEVEDCFKRKSKYKYTIKVIDTKKPVIKFKKELVTEVGTKIDLLKDVFVTDNSKEKIKPTIEGEYDFDKAGEYKLYYIAKDSSENEAKEEFLLKVNERKIEKRVDNSSKASSNNSSEKKTSKGYTITNRNGVTYINGYLIVNKTYSLPSSYGGGLTSETTKNFNIMKSAASKEGLNIYISSGFRSYSRQSTIYNNYVRQDGKAEADTYSARPGHSEHQSGLAFDVNIINDSFAKTPEAKWLENNCYKYGFILRYPKGKTSETGYKYESWHFRYVGTDLAAKLYNNGNWITMESYFGITSTYR